MRVRPDAGRTARLIAAGLLAAVLLGACATRDGGYYQDDGPPRKLSVDPDTVGLLVAPRSALQQAHTLCSILDAHVEPIARPGEDRGALPGVRGWCG